MLSWCGLYPNSSDSDSRHVLDSFKMGSQNGDDRAASCHDMRELVEYVIGFTDGQLPQLDHKGSLADGGMCVFLLA